ncbi:MAG: citramalate synthase, partial [Clostridia bacterium]|nr:citramalate synthase [Deltaproteobacteria bacterium]
GMQRAGMSLSLGDKLRVAERLDKLGVSFIVGGWPGSNPKDQEFFARARDMQWHHSIVTAFGATRRVDVGVEDDPNLTALIDAGTKACTIVGKTWTLHVTEVLRTTLEANLQIIEESVKFLRSNDRRVIYDAEHFFDGYRADEKYALATLQAAILGGAETLVLCDTNGGSMPWETERIVREVSSRVGDIKLGIHCHNDAESAVANSIAAVRGGAEHVQGTINGYGERCGNANLCAIIPNLEIKLEKNCLPEKALPHLFELSRFVAEVANQPLDEYMAYVGRNAFAHKGGIHVAAMRRDPRSYQHIVPELVGNESRVIVSELSGRGNVLSKVEELGEQVAGLAVSYDVAEVLRLVKENEARGFSYEAADASIALLAMRASADYKRYYELIDYMVTVQHRDQRGTFAEAAVKVRVNGEIVHTAAEGDGPVSALDRALRKALLPVYPQITKIKLVDYKVRILDGKNATSAVTRVLIDSTDGVRNWGTVGASANIIEASWRALDDAIEYGLRSPNSQSDRRE